MVSFFVHTIRATAANDFYFVFGSQYKQPGTECELKSQTALLNVKSDSNSTAKVVQWISSSPDIVSLTPSSYGDNFILMNRERPGYSTITAVFNDGTSVNVIIKVNLAFDYQNTQGMITTQTTSERIMVMDTIGQQRTIALKYVDNDTTVGGAIDASFVEWESSNTNVVDVDDTGRLTAIGSGSATIKVSTSTMSTTDISMSITMKVVVAPKFDLSLKDSSGVSTTYNSSNSDTSPTIVTNVPSDFVISSNAKYGNNLTWVVYDSTGGTKKAITEGTTGKLTYNVSNVSGNVNFKNVKAGTYDVYAFANSGYNESSNVPYAYMKLVVPLRISNQNIVMSVNDTYNLLQNSNIPNVNVFGTPTYKVGDSNIAMLDTSNYVITARMKGNVTIQLDYNTATKLYDTSTAVSPFTINISVIDGISLSSTKAQLYVNGSMLLQATVTDPTAPIVWSSSDSNIATVKDGKVTGVKDGIATITASQTIDGVTKTATCTVTVKASVLAVTIDPDKYTLGIGKYLTLKAYVNPSTLSGVQLHWQSSDPSVVKILDAYDLTTTVQGVAGGHAVISAINQDNVVVGYSHITVVQSVTGMTLSETNATVNLAMKNVQLRATISPDNATNKEVTWRSTDTTKATVDANGLVTLLKPGFVTIVATSVDNPAVHEDCNLTILIPVSSVSLLEPEKTMYTGDIDKLKYDLLPLDASDKTVSWTSTNTDVVTVEDDGTVKAVGVGSSVIIIKTADGGYDSYCTITVKQGATSIQFDKLKMDLVTGKYDYLKAIFTPADTTQTNLVWASSDPNVATVDETGKVTAKNGGTTYISAKTDSGHLALCFVTVTQPVTGVKLDVTNKTIFKGDKFDLIPSIAPVTATNQNVTWSSSDTKVATVSNKGEVVGLTGGVAIITCTSADGSYQANCILTVKELVTTIKLNQSSYTLGIGNVLALTATVSTQTATNQKVSWRSTNESVAYVDEFGRVSGRSVGYTTIVATAQDGSGVMATCDIRVVRLVSSITLSKTSVALYVGDSQSLSAAIGPSDATFKSVNWKSSDTSVAIVYGDGTVIGIKAGTATISAEAVDGSGRQAVCFVTVNNRVPSSKVTLQDTKITMTPGETKTIQKVLSPAGTTDSVTWSSDNNSVATVNKTTGKITAKSTGTANVTIMTSSGKTATVAITVIGLNVTKLTTEQYTTYKQALSVEGATSTVKWSSQNQRIVEVSSNGTLSTRGTGTTTVTATINGRKLKCTVVVQKLKKSAKKVTKKATTTGKKVTTLSAKKATTKKVTAKKPTKKKVTAKKPTKKKVTAKKTTKKKTTKKK